MVTTAVTHSVRYLTDLVPFLKDHCEEETYQTLLHAIGSAIHETHLISECVFEKFPDLKEELDARLNKYGRLC